MKIVYWPRLLFFLLFTTLLTFISIKNRMNNVQYRRVTENKMLWTAWIGTVWLHFTQSFLVSLWGFLFTSILDPLYLLIVFVQFLSYLFSKECVINYIEKKLIDPTYRYGSDPLKEFYIVSLNHPFWYYIIYLNCWLAIAMISFITWRYTSSLWFAIIIGITVFIKVRHFRDNHYRRINKWGKARSASVPFSCQQ